MRPSVDQITALHRKYAPTQGLFDLVFTHCHIVEEIAAQLIKQRSLMVDEELVAAGCLLHDIGVYCLFDKSGLEVDPAYIKHGVLGYQILKDEGFPEAICRFASCHTGVGLTERDVTKGGLPLPSGDYSARTPEERLVMFADKFHSKTTPPTFNTTAWYAEYIARFGADKQKKFLRMATEFGEPNISALAKKYGHSTRS